MGWVGNLAKEKPQLPQTATQQTRNKKAMTHYYLHAVLVAISALIVAGANINSIDCFLGSVQSSATDVCMEARGCSTTGTLTLQFRGDGLSGTISSIKVGVLDKLCTQTAQTEPSGAE